MKTYSVCLKVAAGYWVTNWHKYTNLNDVNWDEVKDYCKSTGATAYGYMFGNKSNELTSSRCRTVLGNL